MINLSIILRTARKLKNGAHPICLQITWNNNVRFKTIKGYYCRKGSWDFDEQRYFHSNKKNKELNEYLKRAIRLSETIIPWDYKTFVNNLANNRDEDYSNQKKLISYTRELQKFYEERKQIAYSQNFKAIARFLEECFDTDLYVHDFGERELNAVLGEMDKRGIKGYSYMKFLQIVLSSAIQKGYLNADKSPIKTKYSPLGYDINKRKSKESTHIKKNRIKHLTEEEKESVIQFYRNEKLPKAQKKHLAYWVLGYRLFGVNFKDIAFMKWEDINNNTWYYKRKKTGHEIEAGKPIVPEAMAILNEYDSGGKYILDILNGYDNDEKQISKRLNNYKSNVQRSLKKISERLFQIKYITWYSTRYTAPTLALSKGVDLNTVRTLMNHSSIKTTSRYLDYVRDKEKLTDAMTKL